jgi:SAM-dependent methyltransferase
MVNYNEISKIYDEVREGDDSLIERFVREFPSQNPLHALDIGCGTGNYTDLLQRAVEARPHRVYGLDPSAGMICKARAKNDRLHLLQAAATCLPSKAAFFDFVFMTDVIHHVPDIHRMFSEIHRILKPQGKACIVTQSHRQIEARPIAQFFPGTARVDKARYPKIEGVIAAARSAGLHCSKQEILFEGEIVELGADYLELARKKGYSMLHLLTEREYRAGLGRLEAALRHGPVKASSAGETLLWFTMEPPP